MSLNNNKINPRSPKYFSFLSSSYIIVIVILIILITSHIIHHLLLIDSIKQDEIRRNKTIHISSNSNQTGLTNFNCTFYTCFDIYNCEFGEDKLIKVFIYPEYEFTKNDQDQKLLLPTLSIEYRSMLDAIYISAYYTQDPSKACIFIPALDLLNQEKISSLDEISLVLATLPNWTDGKNHLLLNMLAGKGPNYSTVLEGNRQDSILAGAGFSTWTYRPGFDVAIPLLNPNAKWFKNDLTYKKQKRNNLLLISSQPNLHPAYRQVLSKIADEHRRSILLLDNCNNKFEYSKRCDRENNRFVYPYILREAPFCLVLRGNRLNQMVLMDCLMAGSIPVILADFYVLPFSEVLDWKRIALVLREKDLPNLHKNLGKVSREKRDDMLVQVKFVYEKYFKTPGLVILTTIRIINDRVFPYAALTYEQWNEPQPVKKNVLFLPMVSPPQIGFTAVVLTYNRVDSLFKIIRQLALVPSLAKILVVWNNKELHPPPGHKWPKIGKPMKVIQTEENKLSNRFFPYEEIETDAVLALDDDILMLTTDELEFGFEVWCQFYDRIVGFPSRLHVIDNATNLWKYQSEWTGTISMVLTGVAFYHKHYNYLYTYKMPATIRDWVDAKTNCEDIAFNFLVANYSGGKAPLKVTPRQKFKCAECNQQLPNGPISLDLGDHLEERSECINYFVEQYGYMPLKPVEFRADPLLYKDPIVSKLPRSLGDGGFRNVGTL